MRSRATIFLLIATVALTGCATVAGTSSPTTPGYSVNNFDRPNRYPEAAIGKVFVAFHDGGEMMKTRVEEALVRQGAEVVDDEQRSDTVLRIQARYGVSRRGYLPLSGTSGEFLADIEPEMKSDETSHEGPEQNQLLLGALGGRLFLSDLFATISQQTGASAWFNKKLTGSPDGLCFGRGCNIVKTSVYVTLRIESDRFGPANWRVLVNGTATEPVVLEATGIALDDALEPILNSLRRSDAISRVGIER